MSTRAPRPSLYLSHDGDYDYLTALDSGRVDDGQPPDHWREVTDDFHRLLDKPDGREVGFRIDEFSLFRLDAAEISGVRSGPCFDVPQLTLRNVDAARIARTAGFTAMVSRLPAKPCKRPRD